MFAKPIIAREVENKNGYLACRIRPVLLSWLCVALPLNTAWPAQQNTQPTASGESASIIPQALGIPANCYDSSPVAFNNGAYPGSLVVAGASNCLGNKYLPFRWRDGSWQGFELPQSRPVSGGWVESVSDDNAVEPTLTLMLMEAGYNSAWVKTAGQPPVELSLLAGMTHAGKMVISSRGDHIVGSNVDNKTDSRRAVRWTRSDSGWLAPEDIGPGEAVATSKDGSVVVGNGGGNPWVWMAKQSSGGDLVLLDQSAWAFDITHTGSMIVGKRNKPCATSKCNFYPAPVYWIKEDGQWRLHDLEALDGVDSEAEGVAEVDGRPVIVGYGYTNQQGGILRPVVWLPSVDGSYGAPMRLEPQGGAFESWASAVSVNRNGDVLGWSDRSSVDWTTETVIWHLFGQPLFKLNAGLNDAWYNPATSGQGFFITVFPDLGYVSLAWFTYDTELPAVDAVANLGDPGHRWITAIGPIVGNQATMDIEMTSGGIFDTPSEIVRTDPPGSDGTLILTFNSCNSGTVEYDIPSINRQGTVPIQRVANDNIVVCEALATQ